jgi:hypothetical protein
MEKQKEKAAQRMAQRPEGPHAAAIETGAVTAPANENIGAPE